MKYGCIYLITNKYNNKKYVGQTINLKRRIKEYKYNKNQCYIEKIINKYGFENFTIEILEDNIKLTNLDSREQFWIKTLDTFRSGYNNTTGGKSKFIMSADTIDKMRESSKLFRHSLETKLNKSIPIITFKNNTFKKETSAKIFAEKIGCERTHVTRAAKTGIRVNGFYIFYLDNELREISKLKSKNLYYKKLCDIISEDVETMEHKFYIIC